MYEFASVCSCARLHVCPSVRVSVRRCVCLFCVYVGMHARMYVCMYAGVYLCRYVYMYLCMYIWVYRWNVCPSECMHGNMSARLSAGMYVCMQVWVCICIWYVSVCYAWHVVYQSTRATICAPCVPLTATILPPAVQHQARQIEQLLQKRLPLRQWQK